MQIKGGLSKLSAVRKNFAEPIIRPVYMEAAILPYPDILCTSVLRTESYTLITVHPGSCTAQAVADIAEQVHPEEAPQWLRPFGHYGAIDLSAIRSDPARLLGVRIISIPTYAQYIPPQIQAPWNRYN